MPVRFRPPRVPHLRSLVAVAAIVAVACSSEPALPDFATATAIPADPIQAASQVLQPGDDQAVSPDPDLRILELPRTDTVTFTTAEGDVSWSLSVTAEVPGELVGISRVVDPNGVTRYSADLRNEFLRVDDLHPRVLADADAIGLYATSATDQPLEVGTWEVEVAGNDGAPRVRVAIRSGDPDAPQSLDVVIWSTTDIADTGRLADAWRQQMDATLVPHGLRIGALDVQLAGEGGQGFRTLGIDGLAEDVHAACAAAAEQTGAPARAAVVVLTERIGEGVLSAAGSAGPVGTAARRPDGDIEGFAVATPGTPVLGPASHACVAVAARDDANARGLIALHEILHLAGLSRHTTERNGRAFDRLPDTPECPAEDFDLDRDGEVSREECDARDAPNLMFWAAGGTALTRDQTWRVRNHPLLQPAG